MNASTASGSSKYVSSVITLNVLDTDQEIRITRGFTYDGLAVVGEASTKQTIKAIGSS